MKRPTNKCIKVYIVCWFVSAGLVSRSCKDGGDGSDRKGMNIDRGSHQHCSCTECSKQHTQIKKMRRIEIDGLKSIQKTLKKSKIYFEINEGESALIKRGSVSLKVFANTDYAIITVSNNERYKYAIDAIPKKYHKLYWNLSKMIHKIRKKTIKYTIIRKRELDKLDKVICLISLSGAYTIHFKNGVIAYLSHKRSDIKFIQNSKTKTLPFTYRDTVQAVHFDDAYDTLRSIVHELIRCADIVQKQRVKQSDYAKTWTISWNADTGSVEDIKESLKNANDDGYGYKQYVRQHEGLFKCKYESETTLSSDYNSTNSELSQCDEQLQSVATKVREDGSYENKSISTVHEASYSSANSIKSEASWRNKREQQNKQKNKNNGSYGTLSSIDSIREDEDDDIRVLYEKERQREREEKEAKQKDNALLSWTKKEVCCWLKQNNFSRDVCLIFWNYDIDGRKLLGLSSNALCQMFESMHSVTSKDKKELIMSITRIQSIHAINCNKTQNVRLY